MPESEKRKAYRNEWAKKKYAADPEAHRAYAREQREKHKEKHREANAAYRAKNRESIRAQQKQWRDANKEKIRRNNLRRIGFTPELFEEMLAHQNGFCAVCAADLTKLASKQVHADHCHRTGSARGILCHHCNSALGLLREDPALFQKAIDYLAEPTAETMKRRKK